MIGLMEMLPTSDMIEGTYSETNVTCTSTVATSGMIAKDSSTTENIVFRFRFCKGGSDSPGFGWGIFVDFPISG